MRNQTLSLTAVALLASAAAVQQAWGTSVAQTGSYTYTHVNNAGVVATREIKPKAFDKFSAHVEAKFVRIVERRDAHLLAHPKRGCGSGEQDSASLSQTGTDDRATIVQRGAFNTASLTQAAMSGRAYVVQYGADQQFQASQAGDHEILLAVQLCHRP